MSIELRKAAQDLLQALTLCRMDARLMHADDAQRLLLAGQALRAAIQQAEAKTDEPIGAVLVNRESREGVMLYSVDMIPDPTTIKDRFELVKVYTHPAPGVPDADFDLICNAIDKADTLTMEGDYMLDSDDCIAVVRVMQALLSVRAAMLTATQAQKGQP